LRKFTEEVPLITTTEGDLEMSTKTTRLTLEMTVQDMLLAMSGGNLGAINVCMNLLQNGGKIDPADFMGGLGAILRLDTLNIYDSRIWMLYKDVCGEHLGKMVAVLRAYQLGQLAGVTETALNHAINNYGCGLDLDAVVLAVKERLPEFNAEAF
jgi:hypothetical protein